MRHDLRGSERAKRESAPAYGLTGHVDRSEPSHTGVSLQRLLDPDHSAVAPVPHEDLVKLAVRIYNSRRDRSAYFNHALFGEPVWDMLLALYGFPPGGEELSVTALCYAAEVPPTTALRGLVQLEQKKLVARERDPYDGRRIFVRLTPLGHQVMTRYLSKVHGKLNA